jgi:predicted nucleic acid-binding protein
MPLVVDASIAVKWVLAEPDSDRARALILRGDLAAPDLLRLEVANTLWKHARRGAISQQTARRGWMIFNAVPVWLEQASGLADAALRLAIRHDVTVYDGTYLALASLLGCPVVTADSRLLEVAAGRRLRRRVVRLEDVPT